MVCMEKVKTCGRIVGSSDLGVTTGDSLILANRNIILLWMWIKFKIMKYVTINIAFPIASFRLPLRIHLIQQKASGGWQS